MVAVKRINICLSVIDQEECKSSRVQMNKVMFYSFIVSSMSS